jgi:hypothetical protein
MKLLYTTLALLCFWNTGFSQSYTPFLVEGKIWVVDFVYEPNGWGCDVPQMGGVCSTEYYVLDGDTLLDNLNYQILWIKTRNNSSLALSNSYGSLSKHAYLREDTISQQVFMHRVSQDFELYCSQNPAFDTAQELKIYDFSLNVNDTLTRCFGTYAIRNKSFGNMFRGDSLVKFNEDYQEGIGGFQGPTRYFDIVERENAHLQCVLIDDETMFGTCSPQLLNVKDKRNVTSELHIFPNQVEDEVMVVSAVNQTIHVYSLLGNLVHSETITIGETKVDLSFLTPQIYLVKGSDENGAVSKKIVKL